MKRADLDKRAQRDKFGSGKHGFQSGNPSGGVLPTIPGAEWFDHVQEEIANVIEAANLRINSQQYNQLLTAINKLSTSAVVNNLTSSNTDKPLSALQGKVLADGKLGNSGNQTLNGTLTFNNPNSWAAWYATTRSGQWRFETNPVGDTAEGGKHFNFVFTGADNAEKARVAFADPEGKQTVAYQSWVKDQIIGSDPVNRSGIDLDTATTPQFFINATNGYVSDVGGEHAGLVLGYRNDCTQLIAAGGRLWLRGSDHNPISDPSHWSPWRRLLDDGNGVMLTGDQTIAGTKTFVGQIKGTGVATLYGQEWPKLQLCSHRGDQALLLESGGAAGTHCLIIRAHTDGVVSGGNIARFNLPDVVGTKTLATTEDVSAAVPSGTVAYFATANAPVGWLKANGAAVSRTAYAALFAAIGTRFGAGNGSTTFNLPDLRGEFVRGWDDGRGADRNRALGSGQLDAFQGHARDLRRSQGAAIMHGVNYYQNVSVNDSPYSQAPAAVGTGDSWLTGEYLPHLNYGTPRVAAETRPRNIALLACIKI